MPIYEYRCENGHVLEVMQRMSDDPLEACTDCGAPVQRVFHPVAVHFKGSGFYNTDYGKAKNNRGSADGKGDSSSDAGSSSDSKQDSGSSNSKSSDKKSDSKTSKASASASSSSE